MRCSAIITGYWISQLVFVVAKLGVADALAKGPAAPGGIAKRVGAHAPSLRRVLRALASVGVFAESADGRFRLTPLARRCAASPGLAARLRADDGRRLQLAGLGRARCTASRTGELPSSTSTACRSSTYLRQHPEKERDVRGVDGEHLGHRERRGRARLSPSARSARSSTSAARTATCWRRSCAAIDEAPRRALRPAAGGRAAPQERLHHRARRARALRRRRRQLLRRRCPPAPTATS